MSAHVETRTHAHIGTLVYKAHIHTDKESQGELEKEKKKALINCCLTLLDGDDPVHKSGFYGLYSVPNPLAFSLWSPLPVQQSQDPKWPAPWRQQHPLTVWKNNTKNPLKAPWPVLHQTCHSLASAQYVIHASVWTFPAFVSDCCINLKRDVLLCGNLIVNTNTS